MNKRIKKKRAKLDPMSCPYCGSKVKVQSWHDGYEIYCFKYGCDNPYAVLASKKKNAVGIWNNLKR